MSFAMPMDAPGVRLICREPFDEGGRSAFDHPLATHFEEPDALLIFDDVLVPWDRVFAYNNVEVINRFHAANSGKNHSSHQAATRGLVKLEFVVGLMMEVVKANGADKFLHVQQMVGECVHYIELMKSCMVRAVAEPEPTFLGRVRPPMLAVNTGRMLTARFYSRIVEILQTVGAGGMQMMPSIEDLDSPIAGDIAKYYQGAAGTDAKRRIALFKMAWDVCGDAFGQRQVQYERYHLGDPVRNLANMFLNYDKAVCQRLVAKAFETTGNDILERDAEPAALAA
jgi:anthranilate 3-monooxygenase (FAD)/4-hydroxyphenylacetate 3-monooxygenase